MFTRKRKRVQASTVGASRTEQKWKEKQNIENIVDRALRGDSTAFRTPVFDFVDATSLPDTLHEFLNNRVQVDTAFDSLPDAAKSRWKTPSDFISAFSKADEIPHLEECGILRKREVIEPSTPPVTPNGAAQNAAQPSNT